MNVDGMTIGAIKVPGGNSVETMPARLGLIPHRRSTDDKEYAAKLKLTDKQLAKLKAVFDYKRFVTSDDCHESAMLISMAYAVNTIANYFQEEANDLMEKYDMVHKVIKQRSENLTTAFDLYFAAVDQLIGTDEAKKAVCVDFEVLYDALRKYYEADSRCTYFEGIQIDSLREDGIYGCLVSGLAKSKYMMLKWEDGKWWQYNTVSGREAWKEKWEGIKIERVTTRIDIKDPDEGELYRRSPLRAEQRHKDMMAKHGLTEEEMNAYEQCLKENG